MPLLGILMGIQTVYLFVRVYLFMLFVLFHSQFHKENGHKVAIKALIFDSGNEKRNASLRIVSSSFAFKQNNNKHHNIDSSLLSQSSNKMVFTLSLSKSV